MQFVLMAWDGEDEHALDRRLAVRERHMVRPRQAAQNGLIIEAGAVLNGAGQMVGSVMMLEFPSETEARARLECTPRVASVQACVVASLNFWFELVPQLRLEP